MILTLSKFRDVVFQVLTDRLFCVPIHWLGRTVMCCGEDCPACGYRLPRLMYYMGVQLSSQCRVVEVPSSVAQLMVEACNQVGVSSPLGLAVKMVRGGQRDCWKLMDVGRAQLAADPMSGRVVAQQLALAMRVGGPTDMEGFKEWHARVRVTTRPVLRSVHLFQ